jgi:hypothetical protein
MKPFAQDEGKELVDKTKLNVLLKLQIIEVLQLVVHWENYLLKYLIQD